MERFSLKFLLIITVLLLAGIVSLWKIQSSTRPAAAGWFNDAWQYRKAITLTNSGTGQTNVYITLTIGTSDTARFQADAGDIRFVDQKSKNLNYYLVSGVGTSSTVIHVKFDVYPAGASTFYLYYGNSSATNGFSSADFTTAASNSSTNLLTEERSPAPLAYWSFDEGVGTTVYDSGQKQKNGSFGSGTSAPSWQTEDQCIAGKCILFNGGQTINLPNEIISTTNIRTQGITYQAWVKLTNNNQEMLIFGQNISSGYSDSATGGIRIRDNNKASFISYDDSAGYKYADSNTVLETNKWYLITGSFNNTDQKMYIYVNGKLDNSATVSNTTFSRIISNDYNKFGAINNNGVSRQFFGYIDEAKIYAYARTATQIKQDYAVGKAKVGGKGAGVAVGKDNTDVGSSPPVAYYNFEEGVGTTAYDRSGNNRNTSWVGTGNHWGIGKYGKAASFNGTDDYLSVSIGSTFSVFTISGWIKPVGSQNTLGRFFNIGGGNLDIAVGSSTRTIKYYTAASSWQSTSYTLNNNEWSYLTITSVGSTFSIFVNGIFKQSYAYANSLGVSKFGANSNPGDFFIGLIDEIKIYNYVRTQQQILQDMNAGNPMSQKTPILWLKFDEGRGTTVSNWGIGGTALNATFAGVTIPTWTDGKVGKAAYFNGINSWMTIPSSTALNLPNDITISAWVNGKGLYVSNGTQYGAFVDSNYRARLWYWSQVTGGWVNFYTAAGKVPSGKWSHVVIVNRPGNISGWSVPKIYVNGISQVVSTTDTQANNSGSNGTVYIGEYAGYRPYNAFNGYLDEVKIYNYALSDDEIKLDYNQGSQFVMGKSNQTIGGTTTSLDYCIPGDTTACLPPIAEYKFEEGVDNTAYDTSGNNLNGVLEGTSSWTQGKIGKARSYNGTTDAIKVIDNAILKPNLITAEAWFNITNKAAWGQRILSKTESSGYQLSVNENSACPSNTLCFLFNNGGNYYSATYASSNLQNNTWYHVAGSYDGATAKLFLNGIQVGTTATIAGTINQGAYNMCIGSETDGGNCTSGYFAGKIDQVKIYNYARTPAQIAYDYNGGKPIGWWKFDECEGTMINDWSGVGNTLTVTIGSGGSQVSVGTCSIGDTSAWSNGNLGKINSAMSFDGTDDWLGFLPQPRIQINPNVFTITGYINSENQAARFVVPQDNGIDQGLEYSAANQAMCIRVCESSDTNERTRCSSNNSVPYNTWVHWAISLNNKNIKIYINGILNSEYNEDISIANWTNAWAIGQRGINQAWLKGKLDDVRIYNYALTSEQVKSVYNGGAVNFR